MKNNKTVANTQGQVLPRSVYPSVRLWSPSTPTEEEDGLPGCCQLRDYKREEIKKEQKLPYRNIPYHWELTAQVAL